MRPIRILVVEDDEDFRHLIIQTLELEEDLTIVGLCRTREDAVCTALQTQPDIALMDLSLSRNGMEGVEAARLIFSPPRPSISASVVPSPPSATEQTTTSAFGHAERIPRFTAFPACMEVILPLNESTATTAFIFSRLPTNSVSFSLQSNSEFLPLQ